MGYLLSPERTAAAVASFGSWLNANGLRILGVMIGAFSLSLVVQGVGAAL